MIKKIFFASIFIVIITGIILPGLVRALPYWDVADTITDPVLNGSNSVAKQGNYLYASAYLSDSLVILDVTNPANLSIVGSISDPVDLNIAWDVEISGNYAYVLTRLGKMTVVDVSNPASPAIVTSLLLQNGTEDMEIIGGYAYVVALTSSTNQRLFKIDISNPMSPVIVNSISIGTTGATGNVGIVSGPSGHLYIANTFNGTFNVVDINATLPVIVSTIASTIGIKAIYSQDYVYLVDSVNPMTIIDVSNPTSPVVFGTVSGIIPYSIYIYNDYMYVTVPTGLKVYDVSSPTNPVLIDSVTTTYLSGNEMYADGTVVYASNLNNAVQRVTSFSLVGSAPPTVQLDVEFQSATYSDLEASGGNKPVLTVSGGITTSAQTIEVAQLLTGTATNGSDFSYTSPVTITIPANDYTLPVSVPITGLTITDDATVESNETIDFVLQNPSIDVTIGTQDTTTYTITDDDAPVLPTLSVEFQSATYSDLEASGGNKPVLTVSGGIIAVNQTVEVAQTATTGTNGVDFIFTSPRTITIPANDYTLPVSIPLATVLTITDDATVEQPSETIDFILQNPSIDVVVGTQDTTTYTITDDDAPPLTTVTVEFDVANYSDLESVGGDIPVLTVSGGVLAAPNSIDVAYVNGTATPSGVGADFTFGGTVTIPIPAGSYAAPVLIPMTGLAIVNDSAVEPNETINFILQTPSTDVLIGTQNTTTYTIINNDTSGSSGGGGGGGGGYIRIPTDDDTPTDPVTPPSDDTPAPTQCPYFTEYMKLGDKDVYRGGQKNEVGRLQDFLTKQNFASTMPIDGVFGQVTHYAVAAWQKHYESEILWPWSLFSNEAGTGWFYQSSRRWANMQKGCVEGTILDNGAFLDIDPNRLRVFR